MRWTEAQKQSEKEKNLWLNASTITVAIGALITIGWGRSPHRSCAGNDVKMARAKLDRNEKDVDFFLRHKKAPQNRCKFDLFVCTDQYQRAAIRCFVQQFDQKLQWIILSAFTRSKKIIQKDCDKGKTLHLNLWVPQPLRTVLQCVEEMGLFGNVKVLLECSCHGPKLFVVEAQ